jgi:hypothetical protein
VLHAGRAPTVANQVSTAVYVNHAAHLFKKGLNKSQMRQGSAPAPAVGDRAGALCVCVCVFSDMVGARCVCVRVLGDRAGKPAVLPPPPSREEEREEEGEEEEREMRREKS